MKMHTISKYSANPNTSSKIPTPTIHATILSQQRRTSFHESQKQTEVDLADTGCVEPPAERTPPHGSTQ